eukprot:1682586-Amphidinium_carterae.1
MAARAVFWTATVYASAGPLASCARAGDCIAGLGIHAFNCSLQSTPLRCCANALHFQWSVALWITRFQSVVESRKLTVRSRK